MKPPLDTVLVSQCLLLVRTSPAVLVGDHGDDPVFGGKAEKFYETLLGPPPVVEKGSVLNIRFVM